MFRIAQLLLQKEMLGDYRSHAAAATQPGGQDGELEQGDQQVLHPSVSVGRMLGATQRCLSANHCENSHSETYRELDEVPTVGDPAYMVQVPCKVQTTCSRRQNVFVNHATETLAPLDASLTGRGHRRWACR
jgi:hypothetical protein